MSCDTGVVNFSNRARELTSLSRQHDSISPVVHWKAKREGGVRKNTDIVREKGNHEKETHQHWQHHYTLHE
jgi:hypothetical protein